MNTIPIATGPRDVLREGFAPQPKELTGAAKALENVIDQKKCREQQLTEQLRTVERMHGSHMAMRLEMEHKQLSESLRLPGLPSQQIGLEVLKEKDLEVDYPDVFDGPHHDTMKRDNIIRTLDRS